MIDDKGITILGIELQQGKVCVETPDGLGAICDIVRWFDRELRPCNTYLNAHSFAFFLNGVRYDGYLDGMSEDAVVRVGEDGLARQSKAQKIRDRHRPKQWFH